MVAASVFPSPVFISEILPSCNTMPPMTCTSKGRMPNTRREVSRTTANASCSTSSSVSPASILSRNSSVFALSSSSESFSISGSRAETASTLFWSAFTLRPSPMRKILVSKLAKTFYLAWAPDRVHRPPSPVRLLPRGLYQPVISVSTPVYHIYLARIRVGKDEEGVVEEVHLQRRLLGAHRLHLELLGPHDTRLYLVRLFFYQNGLRRLHGGVPFPLAVPAVELAPPVASHLTLELVRHQVDRSVHVRRGYPSLKYRTVDKEGRVCHLRLGIRRVALMDQLDLRPRDAAPIIEEPGDSLDLFGRVPFQRLRDRDVSPLDRYVHLVSFVGRY